MIAQVQIQDVVDPQAAQQRLRDASAELIERADQLVPSLVERGGGTREVEVRLVGEHSLVVHLHVDCCDAMGANMVNTIAEHLGPYVATLAQGELGLRILSNLSDRRCTRVKVSIPEELLGSPEHPGSSVLDGIVRASEFAEADPYRAATHNKGIMNGIDAVVIATGNDWRAVEAGAHAFAARTGCYRPLAVWRREGKRLLGELETPLALGTVGGALRVHPAAQLCLRILGVSSARELSMVAAATGLATNLAALRALSTEGIQRGHMQLHHRASGGPAAR